MININNRKYTLTIVIMSILMWEKYIDYELNINNGNPFEPYYIF